MKHENNIEDNRMQGFYHNHLSSGSMITNSAGAVEHTLHYAAFGETLLDNAINYQTPYQFAGYERDGESGLNYAEARYYRKDIFISTDPMWAKYPSLTSYHYCSNNPINRIDIDGQDDFSINQETGAIERKITDAKTHSYFLVDKDGNSTLVATYSFNSKGLVQLKSTHFQNIEGIDVGFDTKQGNDSRLYASAEATASLIGAVATSGINDLTIVGGSNSDGTSPAPSTSHKNGRNLDLRYLRKDKSGENLNLRSSELDVKRQNQLNDALFKFGWTDMISEYYNKNQLLNHTSSAKARKIPSDHTTHLHLQGYKPKVTTMPNEDKPIKK